MTVKVEPNDAAEDQARARKSRKMRAAVDPAGFAVGDRVEGNFTDQPIAGWHPATVLAVLADGELYTLEYDDGDEGVAVPAQFVREPFFSSSKRAKSATSKAESMSLAQPPQNQSEREPQAQRCNPPVKTEAPAEMAANRGSIARKEECKICMDARRTHLLIPCGHFHFCLSCCDAAVASGTCPLCQGTIVSANRVHH